MNITQALLTPSGWNRPGIKLLDVRAIFLHWTALVDLGNDAMNMRNFFESLKDSHMEIASAHYGLGHRGDVVQMVPDDEVSYASGWYCYSPECLALLDGADLHRHIISIECCPSDNDGNYSPECYQSQVHLCAKLLKKFSLTEKNLWRHYDACGDDGIHGRKNCPKLFVDHPEKWNQFRDDVKNTIGAKGL